MKERTESIRFIRQYVDKWHTVVLSILSVISSIMLVGVAFMTKLVIDAVEAHEGVLMYVLIAAVLLLAYAIVFGITKYLTTHFGMLATKKIVSSTHHHLLRTSYANITSAHSVEALKIVANDAEIAVTTYVSLYPTIAAIIVKLVLGIALMLYVNYKITLIALAIGAVLLLAMVLTKKPIKAMHKRAQEKVAVSNAYMQESIKNIEVIKALDMSDFVRDGVANRLEDVRIALERRAKYFNVINSLTYFLLELAFLFIVVYGGSLIVLDEMLLADFVVLISLIEIVKTPFMSATNVSNSIYSMIASAERVITLLSSGEDEYIDDDVDEIVFDDVSYSYGSHEVISHLSFTIAKGEKLSILGYSGAGKSTLLKLLLGVIAPTSGEIYVVKGGERISLKHKLMRVGLVPQDIELMSGTIRENITLGRDIENDKIEDALRVAGIYDCVMERGLDCELHEGGAGLSQGQMQRIAIARALISDNEILVLDEPFSALDNGVAREIFERLSALNRTIIIVSHDDFVRDASHRIIEIGEDK